MISPSSPASNEGGSPSDSTQAKGRREQAILMFWSLLFFVVVLAVLNITAVTLRDAVVLFVTKPSNSSSPEVMSPSTRAALVSEKVEPVAAKAAEALKQWRVVTEAAEVAIRAAVDVKGGFHSVQEAVASLQMSVAESRSVGSTVGHRSWELKQAQGEIKEESAAAAQRVQDLQLLARKVLEENPVLEVEEASSADGAHVSPGRQRKRDAFKATISERVAKVGVEKLADDVRVVEEDFTAALSPEDAESIAERVIDDAVISMSTGAEMSRDLGEDEIMELARREILSVDLPSVSPSDGGCLSAPLAQNITRQELERYGADRTAMPDYALGIVGASIVESMTSKTYMPENMPPQEKVKNLARKSGQKSVGPPGVAIHTDSRLGRCWPMQGSRGRLTVMLAEPIAVESVSLEHAAREILLNGGISALKDFSIMGYRESWVPGTNAVGDVLLSEARYLLEGDVIQFYPIPEEYRRVEYAAITLEVESNYGEPAYTCIYRFRVHGSPRTAV